MELKAPAEPDDADVASAVESLLLVAGEPVAIAALATATSQPKSRIVRALAMVQSRLTGGIRLQQHDGKVHLVTAPENAETVQRFLGTVRPSPLSRAALETLAVVAYHQPVTRGEIEAARGVNSDRAVLTLLARGLIEERGRRATLGHPTEYGTTFEFLAYFGLSSLDELPRPVEDETPVKDGAVLGLRVRHDENGREA